MTHLTDLECSMYADHVSNPGISTGSIFDKDSLAALDLHISTCSECSNRIEDLSRERQLISRALAFEDNSIPVPPELKFARPLGFREFALANVVTGLLFWLIQFLWKTLFGELIINGLARLSAIYVPDVYGMFVNATLYFSERGTTMIYTYLGYTLLILIALTLTWLIFAASRHRMIVGAWVVLLFSASLMTPSTAEALERRYSEGTITITSAETIDDTLVVSADTVVIEGAVNGDLFAFARKIIVSGPVKGNLVAFAESVNLTGEVSGMVMTAGSTIVTDESTIGGDFWSGAGNITIGKDTKIAGNATLATETASMAGQVGRDAHLFGESFDIQGSVNEDLVVYAKRINLLGGAHIFGNLSFHTNNKENLELAPTATVDGEIEFLERSDSFQTQSKYLTGKFYLQQLLWIISAFVFGYITLRLFPALRDVTLYGDMEGVKTAGIGLLAMISLPIVAVLVAVTFIGIPVAIIGFISWLLIMYISKIVLASVIGQMIFSDSERQDSLVITLLAGLAIVLVASNIPVIGGVISFVMVIVGSGLIIQLLAEYISDVMASRSET